MKKPAKHSGFALIELILAISIAAILTVVMMVVMIYFYGDVLKSQATAELAIESQTVLRRIVEDTRLADAIRSTNQINDPNSPVGGWTTSDPSNVLIVATPATDDTQSILYNPDDAYPYENEVVYFGIGNSMYRRTLKNTDAIGNIAITTCPEDTVTASCPSDTTLSEYLTNLTFVFYDINNQTTSDATQARSISITINLQRTVYGNQISFNNTVRTTLRNY